MASDRACSFCGKPEADVMRLHDGPRGAICNECIVLCRGILVEERRNPAKPAREPGTAASSLDCSFCGRNQHDVAKLIAGPTVFICDGCVGRFDGPGAD